MNRLIPLLERYHDTLYPNDNNISSYLNAAIWVQNDLCILLYQKFFNKTCYFALTDDEKTHANEQFSFIEMFDQIPCEENQLTNMHENLLRHIQEFTSEELDLLYPGGVPITTE